MVSVKMDNRGFAKRGFPGQLALKEVCHKSDRLFHRQGRLGSDTKLGGLFCQLTSADSFGRAAGFKFPELIQKRCSRASSGFFP